MEENLRDWHALSKSKASSRIQIILGDFSTLRRGWLKVPGESKLGEKLRNITHNELIGTVADTKARDEKRGSEGEGPRNLICQT